MGDVLTLVEPELRFGGPLRLVASAGAGEGRGHLSRALAVAEAAAARGEPVELLLLRGEPSPGEAARAAATGALMLPPPALACAEQLVIVDLPDPNEVAGQFDPAYLVVFDDREVFRGTAALVVQPSQPTWNGTGRAQAGRVLAGFAHVPLGRTLRESAAGELPLSGERARPDILLCFGGSDPDDATGRLLPAMAQAAADEHWALTAVVGPDYRGAAHVPAVLRDPPDLLERLAGCDLAILAAGTMKFEAALLGRPMLLLAAADDQLPVGPAFAATGAASWLGDARTIDPQALVAAARAALADVAALRAMGRRARGVVDGRGADRILDAALVNRSPRSGP